MQAGINGNESTEASHKDKKTFVILTCDGGGVRALLQLMFLEQLAKDVGSPITKFIDSTTLCSGGAITGLSLIARKDKKSFAPKFTETEATQTFLRNCGLIFPSDKEGILTKAFNKVAPSSIRTLMSAIKTLWRIRRFKSIYSSDNQRKVIESQFGDAKAKDTLAPFFIPTTDFQTGAPIWLTNLKGIENSHHSKGFNRRDGERIYYVPEMKIADVLLASIRPPLVFDLKKSTIQYQEKDENGIYHDKSLEIIGTDGAFYAASPETYAYGLALHWLENIKKMKRNEYRIVLLSVGTGRRLINNDIETIHELDPISQINTIRELALVLPYRAGQGMLRSRMHGNGDLYLRIDANIDTNNPEDPSPSLSDANPENLGKFRAFVMKHFVGGENKKEYGFAVELFRRIAKKESIEELVQNHLGEKYWPLNAATEETPPPPKKGTIRRFFSWLGMGGNKSNHHANQNTQHQETRNPSLERKDGLSRKPK